MTRGKVRHLADPEADELFRELRHLLGVLREAAENFVLRREGEIEALVSHLEGLPAAVRRAHAPGWLQEVRVLKLKPEKGRMKDLKGIDALLERLAEEVVSTQKEERIRARR